MREKKLIVKHCYNKAGHCIQSSFPSWLFFPKQEAQWALSITKRSSAWIKVGCRKGIYYQTRQVIHWNLLRINTTNAIMWCDIFHLFVGRNKKRKPVIEGNFRLNINIEGHIADLHCLFPYFKNIWPFLLTLISLNRDVFLPSFVGRKRFSSFQKKKHLIHWWHNASCLISFYDIIMSYTFQ